MAKGGDCVVKHAGVFVTGMGMVVREWEWWYGSGDSGDCVVKHAGVFVTGMGMVVREWEWWYGSGDSGDCVVKHAGVIVTGMVIRVPPISYKTLLVCSTPL